MCKTTTGSSAAGERNLLDYPPSAVPAAPEHSLKEYLVRAYDEARDAGKLHEPDADRTAAKLQVPISLLAHVNSGNHYYAGVHDDEMHYSASVLKVAAMFAAYKLRTEARALAASRPATDFANQAAFFAALAATFDPNDALPAIRQLAGVRQTPNLPKILQVTGFGTGALRVDFLPEFLRPLAEDHAQMAVYNTVHAREVELGLPSDRDNDVTLVERNKLSRLYRVIVLSDTQSSGHCIKTLSYAYINVQLMKAGLYDLTATPPLGIWLAGDYVAGPRAEVTSVNDALAAQVTTSRHMARFFSDVYLKAVTETPGPNGERPNRDMKALLYEAAVEEPSWLMRRNAATRKFTVEAVKIGFGNLKPNPNGPLVYSEGLVLEWKDDPDAHDLTGSIAVCWQNLREAVPRTNIAKLIERAVSDFIAQSPLE